MKISKKGINLIKQFEGCRLVAYKCPAGVWTIGYGHTNGVVEGQTITQSQADELLKADLEKYEKKVEKYDKYCWNQNEFDALVSFAYNLGSIDQLTANGMRSRSVIADKMLLYNKANGKVLNGLVKRRKAERELFLTQCEHLSVQTFSVAKQGLESVSRNFKVREFKCKDGSDKVLIDVGFVENYLQKIRDHFGTPITINSAYRTEPYNRKVGGASKSYHIRGQAFDIVVKGHTPSEVAKYSQSIGILGIGEYKTFTHVDSRSHKYYWDSTSGREVPVNGF